jgi:hypothetical protein
MQVNSSIIEMAYTLYECDLCENKKAQSLQGVVDLIKSVSDIDCNDWDCLKVVSAVKIICYPKTQDSKVHKIAASVILVSFCSFNLNFMQLMTSNCFFLLDVFRR